MAESRAATREQLQELHKLVAEKLLQYLTEVPTQEMSASWLAVAAKFLEANGVTVNLAEVRDVRKALSELSTLSLPFPISSQ